MNSSTLLHRQINPSWIQAGRVTSMAFRPTPKDDMKLSVYNGDLIAPEGAWRHFTEVQGLQSAGVRSVSVEECQQLELEPIPDPAPFPEHAVIDFSNCASDNQREKRAKKLNVLAQNRGWLFLAETDT